MSSRRCARKWPSERRESAALQCFAVRSMTVHAILKMGDSRLLRVARPVERFGTPELRELVADMFETMHAAGGAGLAAPQIGVDLALVIFGFVNNSIDR